MKRIFTFLLIVFAYLTASAESVSEQQALQKAQQFMKGKQLATSPYKARARGRLAKDTVAHGYYVFNTVESNGFVIIASDDRMPEVLGYSEHGSLDPATAPCNVKWLLEYYDKAAANIKLVGAKARTVRKASKPDVRPLITTTWDQGAPYNLMCPEFNGAQCITGCVATAMAQVINYNRWPVGQTTGVPAYITGTNQISVPALGQTRFDWDNMTNDDVARLMRYCGQSVQMDYGVNESGALPVNEAPALTKVFGYSQTAHYAEHANYSEDEWEDLLYNELAEQRPIVFNGFGGSGGHTFVVHGYRDGRFYINWGWSGNEDGYFYLTSLNTSAGDYSSDQSATIGIMPPAGSDVNRPKVVVQQVDFYGAEKYLYRNDEGSFVFTASGSLVSDLPEQKNLSIGLALYDDSGLKKVLWQEQHLFPVGEVYRFNATITIGSDVADGEYRIVPVCRDGNGDWLSDANSSDYYLKATVNGRYLMMQAYPLSSEQRSITDLGIQTIDGITYNLYVQKEKKRASVLLGENGKYSGDLYVPDDVRYEGTDYRVYKADYNAFQDCDRLTSLSVGMSESPNIWNCGQLKKIELREGVTKTNSIGSCDLLESIEYPKSVSIIQGGVMNCGNLKTIRFKNTSMITFGSNPEWGDASLPKLTDIYFASLDTPKIGWKDGNMQVHSTATIHVPQGSKADYENGDWKGWKILDDQSLPDVEGIEWGYCEGNAVAGGGPYDQVGGNDGEFAIHVPSEVMAAYKGKTVSRIQIYQAMEYDYVFITKPGTDYIVKESVEGPANSWIDVVLPEPYTITGDELFVGVGHRGTIGMVFSDDEAVETSGLWFRTMGQDDSYYETGEWINIAEQDASSAHPIPVRFIITGNDMPSDAVMKDVTLKPVNKTSYTVTAKVHNRMMSDLKKVTVSWDFDGKNQGGKTIDVDVRPARSQSIKFDITTTLDGRNHDFHYTVTEVDGKADAVAANSSGTINFNTAANTYYPRQVVMEEATGTWCGWCVRGIETIERLTKQYPDNFIAIALHNGDEMANHEGYGDIARKFSSYPGCIINRVNKMDPRYPKVWPLVEEMKDRAEAKVSATAAYAKPDSSAVTVTSESIFGFSDDKTANFRLAYAVVEDHVGPYVQNNYYSGESLSGEEVFMDEWTRKDAKVKIEFNDVGRALYGGAEGVEGSAPKTVKEGEKYRYAYSLSLPDNIANKKNIRIVVMLIDSNTGEVMNACQTTIDYDKSVESQVFELRNAGRGLVGETAITYVSVFDRDSKVADCGTNLESGKEGLMIRTFDGKQAEGTAKLEILSNTVAPQQLTWTMGGTSQSLIGKTTSEMSFKTDDNGHVAVDLLAKDLRGYGQLEVRLTVAINGQTEKVKILFINEKPVVEDITPQDDQVWWYNHDPRDGVETLTVGAGQTERYHVATFIPFNMLGGKGTTIDGFSFYARCGAMSDVTVWVSAKLPDSDSSADMEVRKVPDSQIKEWLWHDVSFLSQHEIPEEGLYVGYSFGISDWSAQGAGDPFETSKSDKDRKEGFLVKCAEEKRWNYFGKRYGNVYAKVLFGGGTFNNNAVKTSDFAPVAASLGDKTTVFVTLTNDGANEVSEVAFNVKGQTGEEYVTKASVSIPSFSERICSFELQGDKVQGVDEKSVTVTTVNGKANTATEGITAKGLLFSLANAPARIPVIEETTGIWDSWASTPKAYAKHKLNEIFGDQLIIIMPHYLDVIESQDYKDVFNRIKWNTFINRTEAVDGTRGKSNTPFGIENDVIEVLKDVAPAKMSVRAEWIDEKKTGINIYTETTCDVDVRDNPFVIGYVLVEDGMHGNGDNWIQKNPYSGWQDTDDPIIMELAAKPEMLIDFKHDFVPVAAWGASRGIEGTLPTSLKAGEKNRYTYRVDIGGNLLIQEKENLSVIALLLDKQFGTIINAAKYRLGKGGNQNPDSQTASFEFRHEGKALSNNYTVEIPAALDSYGFGELECMTNPSSNPKNGLVLATKDGKKVSGTATITISKNTLNPNMVQWCMGGECVPMNGKSSLTKNFTTDDEGICQVMFDATNIKSEGVLEARLSATVSNETRVVNIKFIYSKTAGLNIIYSEDDGAVWYDMNGTRLESAPTRKGVYIRNGKKVVR